MNTENNSKENNDNKNSFEESKDNISNKNNSDKEESEKEESEKEDEKEEESDKESESNSKENKITENGTKKSVDKEKENEEEEEEENNEEEDNEEEESVKNDNQIKKENETNENNNSKNNFLKSTKKYKEDKNQTISFQFNLENKKIDILEEYKNNYFINNIYNEEKNSKEISKNLKTLKEIDEDLTEISDNIEKIFLKLDTSSIHDEKFLIDSLIVEAKKEGILEETFGENENENIIQKQEQNKLSNNNSKIIENEKNSSLNNNKRISMSKIYENSNKESKKKFPYDYNKNREYYEALNKKMNYNMNNLSNISSINYLKNSLQSQSDLFKSNEKDYFINNNQINNKRKIYNNNINNLNNFSFKNNMNISNNLLSSTDTSGPFRYTRKNMDEPDLMKLLMNK